MKNLCLFLGGAVCSLICFYAALTVLPLYVYELGGREFDIGLQTVLYFSASILYRFYFGPLTDKKGRKLPLMIGAFAFSTSSLLFLFCHSVWSVALVRIYHAVGLATFFSSGGSLIVDLAPPGRVGLYIGFFRTTFVLALLTGPPIAMAIINTTGFSVWFVVSFLVGLASLILVAQIKEPHQASTKTAESGSIEMFWQVLKGKAAHLPLYGISLLTLSYSLLTTFAILFITQYSQFTNPGLYFTYFSLIAIAGNLTSGYISDRWGRPIVVWPSIMCLSIGVGILFLLPQFALVFYISSILAGLGYSGGMASLAAWLVEVTDENKRGTVLALQESVIDLNNGISAFVFGILSGFLGMGLSFALIGFFVFALALAKFLAPGHLKQVMSHKIE